MVKVNNNLTEADIPTPRTDWLNYGGITRDVRLLELPNTFIRNVKLQLDPETPDRLRGYVEVDGAATGTVELSIPELGLTENLRLEAGRADVDLAAAPERWSPGNPKRYEVVWTTEQDTLVDQVGFRTIEVEDREVLLNGEPVFLKGISIHEEAIGSHGRTSSPAEAKALLQQARDLGCNFVRLAHYTHNEHMLRAADAMGLLVWAEIPVYWNVQFDNPEVLEMAQTRMREMIRRDQNRASIIFWSLGNETPKSEARNTFFRKLNAYVKSLDDTRLTTAALVFGGEEIQKAAQDYFFPTLQGQTFDTWDIHIEDPLAAIVDVAAVNQYFGWYYSGFLATAAGLDPLLARRTMLDNLDRIRFHIPEDKPFVFSELGAGAKRGLRGPEDKMVIFSEDYQALVYRRQIEMIRQQDGLVGLSPWILKDFRSPMRLNQGIQDYWNRKGLISDNGEPKQAFFVLRDFYRSLGR